jgi:hypothetical protein
MEARPKFLQHQLQKLQVRPDSSPREDHRHLKGAADADQGAGRVHGLPGPARHSGLPPNRGG